MSRFFCNLHILCRIENTNFYFVFELFSSFFFFRVKKMIFSTSFEFGYLRKKRSKKSYTAKTSMKIVLKSLYHSNKSIKQQSCSYLKYKKGFKCWYLTPTLFTVNCSIHVSLDTLMSGAKIHGAKTGLPCLTNWCKLMLPTWILLHIENLRTWIQFEVWLLTWKIGVSKPAIRFILTVKYGNSLNLSFAYQHFTQS